MTYHLIDNDTGEILWHVVKARAWRRAVRMANTTRPSRRYVRDALADERAAAKSDARLWADYRGLPAPQFKERPLVNGFTIREPRRIWA